MKVQTLNSSNIMFNMENSTFSMYVIGKKPVQKILSCVKIYSDLCIFNTMLTKEFHQSPESMPFGTFDVLYGVLMVEIQIDIIQQSNPFTLRKCKNKNI